MFIRLTTEICVWNSDLLHSGLLKTFTAFGDPGVTIFVQKKLGAISFWKKLFFEWAKPGFFLFIFVLFNYNLQTAVGYKLGSSVRRHARWSLTTTLWPFFNGPTLQCDQIGWFIWLWATFLKPLATKKFPKSPTFLGNFCRGIKIYHFFSAIILGNFL